MAVIQISKIQIRRGQELQTGIPQLDAGELGWAQDTEHLYIGKRIIEGASDDRNTRILTENDLNYFQVLVSSLNNTSTAASSYEYREGILLGTTTTTIQKKLDSLDPSLIDFGVNASTGTYVQIDSVLQTAVDELFNNLDPNVRLERRRPLKIPAGSFYLSNTVTLPPYTRLSGAGPGLTRIKYTNTITSMFKTVDAAGNTFEDGNMQLSTGSSKDIVIEGITFEFSSSASSYGALLSLDNVDRATIQDCVFQTEYNPESTSTYGIVESGIGIHMRGQGTNGTEQCRDIIIDRCEFNGLQYGVLGTGTVVTPSIRYGKFKNLKRGVYFTSNDSLQGPTNGYIAYNRFEDIAEEGIYLAANPNGKNGNHLSTQNHFTRVGGTYLNEFVTSTSVTSVLGFYSHGNKTVDDYFARRDYLDSIAPSASFYYNPYVRGNTTIANGGVYTATVSLGINNYYKIPLNGEDQMVTVNYQLYNNKQSRKGRLIVNITPTGGVSLSDTYNYVETLVEDTTGIIAEPGSTVNLLILNTATNTRFADVQANLGVWYLTGDYYAGNSAYITGVINSGSYYLVTTDSASPAFDFSSTGTWTLLQSESTIVEASYDTTYLANKNFISLSMNSPTTSTFTLNYQVDIQT